MSIPLTWPCLHLRKPSCALPRHCPWVQEGGGQQRQHYTIIKKRLELSFSCCVSIFIWPLAVQWHDVTWQPLEWPHDMTLRPNDYMVKRPDQMVSRHMRRWLFARRSGLLDCPNSEFMTWPIKHIKWPHAWRITRWQVARKKELLDCPESDFMTWPHGIWHVWWMDYFIALRVTSWHDLMEFERFGEWITWLPWEWPLRPRCTFHLPSLAETKGVNRYLSGVSID